MRSSINIKPITLAILISVAAPTAHATQIMLYGVIDAGVGNDHNKGNRSYSRDRTDDTKFSYQRLGMNNGVHYGSRWGIRGVEDLGDGLSVKFTLENGFDTRTGMAIQGGRMFGRQATLGLSSEQWGQVDFGRKNNMPTEYYTMAHPLGGGGGIVGFGSSISVANTVRYDNQIQYQSPVFSGAQFGVGYSFNINGPQQPNATLPDGSNAKDRNIPAITSGVRYNNGGLSAALVYDQLRIHHRPAGNPQGDTERTTVQGWAAGASYDMQIVKFFSGIGQTRDGLFAAQTFMLGEHGPSLPSFAAIPGLRINSYSFGATTPLAGGRFSIGWNMADPRQLPSSITGPNASVHKQQVYSVGYNYDLSKRTMAYIYAGYARHLTFLPDARATQLYVAFNHRF